MKLLLALGMMAVPAVHLPQATQTYTKQYEYSGSSTDADVSHTEEVVGFDSNFVKRRVNVDFNFATWNDHIYSYQYILSNQDTTKTLINLSDKKYPLIHDTSGAAQQDISIDDIQLIYKGGHYYLWWKYWVFSSWSNNDVRMRAVFNWSEEPV